MFQTLLTTRYSNNEGMLNGLFIYFFQKKGAVSTTV